MSYNAPLKYRGINYRTPLEAKWAAYFHHLRLEYIYDPDANGCSSTTFLVCQGEKTARVLVDPKGLGALLYTRAPHAWTVGARGPVRFDLLVGGRAAAFAWAKATNDITGLVGVA